MATKTINLTGAEVAVTGLDGAHAHIRNDGTEVIYAAKTAGITAGADGVASIPAGQSDTIRGISGAVYLLGTGSVLIQSDDYVTSPFKTSAASGGSAVDEVARAAVNTHAGNAEIHVTAEEKAAWNAVNYSNPNLLINPDFRINQRGNSVYSTKGFTCDKWKLDSNGTVSFGTGGGITLSSNENAPTWFFQTFENPFLLDGKTVTLSVCDENGVVYTLTGYVPEGHLSNPQCVIDLVFCSVRGQLWKRNDDLLITQIAVPAGKAVSIKWIKLEFGNFATPFFSPDPATELAKCQRYYQIRSTGDIAAVDMRPSMRATPTVTQLADGNYAYSAEL